MEFRKQVPDDYYQNKLIKEYNPEKSIINYDTLFYQRNPEVKGKLSLNHIEVIEFFVRLLKPKNFIELGVQFGEATKSIIPFIPNEYIAIDIVKTQNINYFENQYKNFQFHQLTTDQYFENMKTTNLKLEMGFIDACHSHEASYKDFLNLKDHMIDDGVIFFHDSYPYSEYWSNPDLCGDAYKTIEKIRKEHNNEFEIFTIPVNPGLSIARKVRKQLAWLPEPVKLNETFGFIIAGCVRTKDHQKSLNKCLDNLRIFHPNQKRVVIVDFTSDKLLIGQSVNDYPEVIFELDTPEIPADMLLLKYFKQKHYFDKAILLQDSMQVIKEFDVSSVKNIKYIWHFNNHRVHWSTIKEPSSDYNVKNGIVSHDDLVVHCIETKITSPNFKSYCKDIYHQKMMWSGCFGCCCIISYDFLLDLDSKTNIIEFESQMTTNRLRRVIESIFPLACQYTLGQSIFDSYDGLYYDGVDGHGMTGNYIIKVSFDRQ